MSSATNNSLCIPTCQPQDLELLSDIAGECKKCGTIWVIE